jgi:predicted dehydrogenase
VGVTEGHAPVEAREPLRFAVVGLGYWGPNLVRVLTDSQDAVVTWLCDVDADRREQFARRYPATRVTADVDEVLSDESLDAVVIATPIYTHVELCTRALLAEKHVFVEKPLATSTALATELVRLSEIQGQVLMCGHTFVYSPAVMAIKEMLAAQALGKVYFISSSRVNLGLHQRDVSVMWDLGPHDFSILLHWIDEMPASVRAVGRDSIVPGIVDVAFVTLSFPSGLVAQVELSWLAPSKLRRTVIVGSEKMVVYDDGAVEPVRVFDHGVVYRDPETFGQYHLSYRTGDVVSPKLDSHEPLQEELADFAGAIRSGRRPRCDTRLACDVVRLTEAADRALQSGHEISLDLLPGHVPTTSDLPVRAL